ncbi:GNAT family N-acetyltransferase [Frigoribacterium sp. CG_9.8]|uniref:GNAT family N-acetyltransferase n=1 Tax=Frigoribacterium sp. CG_9.8 TaxID=2787733 RepID=UPI0018C9425C|nr:GNAT family N-acetyltransferase [Frigoribacterium sp. CG_9.8]MBG6106480.1 GNAT superfamily N-acetyltransferase [Frigoribacterium sp. CG_9.8]
MIVRRAEAGEGQLMHELPAATFGLACPPGTTGFEIANHVAMHLSAEIFEGYLSDPDREILVALSATGFVGYTMLVFGDPEDADVAAIVTARPTAELSKCYVLADEHGGGVASELMMATIAVARLRGPATIWLGVNDKNDRANRFYGKHGFEHVGFKRFALGDRFEDDFVRELTL